MSMKRYPWREQLLRGRWRVVWVYAPGLSTETIRRGLTFEQACDHARQNNAAMVDPARCRFPEDGRWSVRGKAMGWFEARPEKD